MFLVFVEIGSFCQVLYGNKEQWQKPVMIGGLWNTIHTTHKQLKRRQPIPGTTVSILLACGIELGHYPLL